MARRTLNRIFGPLGYELVRKRPEAPQPAAAAATAATPPPVEFDPEDVEIADYILANDLTGVSAHRLYATINACKHAVAANLPGDFVECGVWKGGNTIAAKLTFERLGSDKRVILFDTFAGMTAPTAADVEVSGGGAAADQFETVKTEAGSDWCFCPLETVRENFTAAGVDMAGVQFVEGDVLKTLRDAANLPDQISVLRLDTDWYESTLAELEVLYPRLTAGGVLLIDDYGHCDGARRAVEEYFSAGRARPYLQFTHYTGRAGVKV